MLTNKSDRRLLLFTILAAFLLVGFLEGQIITSSIVGQVTDSTGAAVPEAQIKVTNTGTGISAKGAADSSGAFSITNLQPGVFTVEVEKDGFKTYRATGLQVLASQAVRADARLEVGNTQQTIEVTSEAPLVQTESPTIGGSISVKQMADLPLSQQSIDGLIALVPGAQTYYGAAHPLAGGSPYWGSMNFTINGTQANDFGNGSAAYSYSTGLISLPPIESLQEFKVEAYNTNAEYREIGTVTMVTKAGTNQYHGEAVEFNQNTSLDANTFTNNALGKPRNPSVRNQFGGDIGGPIAPALKNKAFFFFDYFGTRIRNYSNVSETYPSAAMRNGDFSALSGATQQLYDPLSGSPFPNNQVPTSRITSQAKAVLGFVPLPAGPLNAAGLPSGGANYYSQVGVQQDVNSADLRVDYHVSDKDQLYGVYTRNVANPYGVALGYPSTYGNATNYGYKTFGYSLVETHTFSPTTLNDFRFAWFNHPNIRAGMNLNFDPTTLFPQLTKSPNAGLPNFSMTGYTSVLDQGKGYYSQAPDTEFSDNITHVFGRHTFKAGAMVTFYKTYGPNPNAPLGSFSFTGSWTGNSGWSATQPTSQGNAFADFLLGDANSSSTGSAGVFEAVYSDWDTEFFAQDTWQASSKLTITYGVRYSYQAPWQWQDGYSTYWDPATNRLALPESSTTATLPGFGASAAMFNAYNFTTTTALGIPQNYMIGDKNNWAPRLGIAWRPFNDTRTVFRAGYGVYYAFVPSYVGARDDILNPPWNSGLGGFTSNAVTYTTQLPGKPATAYLPDITFANPFPSGNQSASSVAAHPTLYSMQRDFKNNVVQQWTGTLEHQFTNDWAARITYAGEQGHHLTWFFTDFNIPAQQTPNVSTQNQRPYQPWGVIDSTRSGGSQNFEQLQLEATKRVSRGLSFQAEYAWTRSLDNVEASGGLQNPNYPGLDYGNSTGSQRHSLVFNYVWEVPVGRGHQWLANSNKFVDGVLGGWEVSGITTYKTGSPFSVAFSVPSNYTGWWGGRANQVGSNIYAGQTGGHDIIDGVTWFNTSAFAPPQPWQWGNAARNMVWGPGMWNWDMSGQKSFTMKDRFKFTLRGDFLDAFNHMNLNNPSATIADTRDGGTPIATSGKIYAGYGTRIVQVGARFTF